MEVNAITKLINSGFLTAAIMLLVGGLVCFRGLKLYKILQFLICGLLGASIGLGLRSYFGRNEFYIVAIVIGLIAGIWGYKHYKAGLYLCAVVSTYFVVVSSFLHTAYGMVRTTIADIPDANTLLLIWLARIKEAGDLNVATTSVIGEQTSIVIDSIKEAVDLLQRGMLYALIASLIVGLLALWLGDFVIIVFTAALGSAMLTTLIEMYFQIGNAFHFTILIGITILGIVLQYVMKKNT